MSKGIVTPHHLQRFKEIAGEAFVLADAETLQHYGHDETEQLLFPPEVVIKPRTAAEISAIMRICNEHCIAVTPRGAGTGLSGGALPHLGGQLELASSVQFALQATPMRGGSRLLRSPGA